MESPDILKNLFAYYQREKSAPIKLSGNTFEMQGIITESAYKDPETFIPFFERIAPMEEVPNSMASAVWKGMVKHLDEEGPVTPATLFLTKVVIDWMDKFFFLREDIRSLLKFLQLACKIIDDPDHATKLLFLLMPPGDHPDPEISEEYPTDMDINTSSRNSVRGVAATCAMHLAINALNMGRPLPALLSPLLFRFATDQHPGVQLSVLELLPDFAKTDEILSWQLFEAIFKKPYPNLWPRGEVFLLGQYEKNYPLVRKILRRIKVEAFDTGAKTWGKIRTLSYLSGYVTEETLLSDLKLNDNPKAWLGANEAFEIKIKGACMDTPGRNNPVILTDRLINFLAQSGKTIEIRWFYKWLEQAHTNYPFMGNLIYERVLAGIQNMPSENRIIHMKNLGKISNHDNG